MKKNKTNRAWVHDHLNDPYVQRARAEGYRARAAYKLLEIDERELEVAALPHRLEIEPVIAVAAHIEDVKQAAASNKP